MTLKIKIYPFTYFLFTKMALCHIINMWQGYREQKTGTATVVRKKRKNREGEMGEKDWECERPCKTLIMSGDTKGHGKTNYLQHASKKTKKKQCK